MTMTAPQPYLTAADGVSQVATVGPIDTNAPTRVKSYAVLAALLGLIPLLTVFKIVTTDQGAAIGQFVQSGIGLAGAFGFAFVATKTKKQVDNGTFAAAPVGTVFQQLNDLQTAATSANAVIKTQIDDAISHATTQVAQATAQLGAAVSLIPGGGIVSGAITSGPVGDLIQHFADHGAEGIVAPATTSTPSS